VMRMMARPSWRQCLPMRHPSPCAQRTNAAVGEPALPQQGRNSCQRLLDRRRAGALPYSFIVGERLKNRGSFQKRVRKLEIIWERVSRCSRSLRPATAQFYDFIDY